MSKDKAPKTRLQHVIFQYLDRFLFILKTFAEHFIETIFIYRFVTFDRRLGNIISKLRVSHLYKAIVCANDLSVCIPMSSLLSETTVVSYLQFDRPVLG